MPNNFSKWKTKEIKKWVEEWETFPQLRNEQNIKTYKEAIKELFKRTDGNEYYKLCYFTEVNPNGTIEDFNIWFKGI